LLWLWADVVVLRERTRVFGLVVLLGLEVEESAAGFDTIGSILEEGC